MIGGNAVEFVLTDVLFGGPEDARWEVELISYGRRLPYMDLNPIAKDTRARHSENQDIPSGRYSDSDSNVTFLIMQPTSNFDHCVETEWTFFILTFLMTEP